jgi:hypothetical protein
MPTNSEKPYIIYTLRRTGGTSLAAFLSRVSSFPTVQHEPFNPERAWGAITQDWLKVQDKTRARAQIDAVLQRRPNVKHCVEVVPIGITRILIDLCQSLGYAQFVLHRRSEADRLMSLYMAMSTGAWGGKDTEEIYRSLRSGAREALPVSPETVVRRAGADAAAMGETLMQLRSKGIDFGWLVFEEIYADATSRLDTAVEIARRMARSVDRMDPNLKTFLESPGQGSTAAMGLVPGAEAMRRRLDELFG